MSNGLCRDTCSKDGYAVAVLSGNDCYCTNDVPADTTDMSNCEIDVQVIKTRKIVLEMVILGT